jgi:hypothetical protein
MWNIQRKLAPYVAAAVLVMLSGQRIQAFGQQTTILFPAQTPYGYPSGIATLNPAFSPPYPGSPFGIPGGFLYPVNPNPIVVTPIVPNPIVPAPIVPNLNITPNGPMSPGYIAPNPVVMIPGGIPVAPQPFSGYPTPGYR